MLSFIRAHRRHRVKKYTPLFQDIFSEGERLLDVGLGNGLLAKSLEDTYRLSVQGLDVVDTNTSSVPLQLYDGTTFPYKTNSFDWVLLFAVLHHCDDIERVLLEARRVAKKGVIVYENPYTNPLNKLFVIFYDFLANYREGVNCPYHHKTYAAWKQIFAKIGLRIFSESRSLVLKYFVHRSHRVLWVLR